MSPEVCQFTCIPFKTERKTANKIVYVTKIKKISKLRNCRNVVIGAVLFSVFTTFLGFM